MNDNIKKIIEKIMDVDEAADTFDGHGGNASISVRNDARTQPRDKPEPLNKEESYDDWIKKQPRSNAIGYHKNKQTPVKK